MGRYRKIDPRIWGDEKFRALSGLQPSGKALWLYLLTNPFSSNFAAAIPIGCAAIADDLGWPVSAVEKCFSELDRAEMIARDKAARLIYLRRWVFYNAPESPNVAASWATSIAALPESALREIMLRDARVVCAMLDGDQERKDGRGFVAAFDRAKSKDLPTVKAFTEPLQQGLLEGLPEGIPQSKTKQSKAETETKQKQNTDLIADVYEHYRKYHGHAAPVLRSASKEYRAIKERLSDGYSVDDLKLAIDGNHLDPWHCEKDVHHLTLIMRDSSHVQKFIDVMSKETGSNG